MTTPTERLAAALDAIPGIDDLETHHDFVKMADIQSVRDALMDVMLGMAVGGGTRTASGINSHIRFARQPTLAQLIQWQAKLQYLYGEPANEIAFVNTGTGLAATNVQDAIEELAEGGGGGGAGSGAIIDLGSRVEGDEVMNLGARV